MSDKPTYRCMVCNVPLDRPENYCDYCGRVVRCQREMAVHVAKKAEVISDRENRTVYRCEMCGALLSQNRIRQRHVLCKDCHSAVEGEDVI
jgi:uncharacterized C2H2 Zn-finger protein